MTISYKTIVPWGRSLDEYCRMFSLGEADLKLAILGCGDGPASFNAEMTKREKRVISADPLYQFSLDQIKERIRETYNDVLTQVGQHQELYHWTHIQSVEDMGRIRMDSMTKFLADFELGKAQGRYVFGELPKLPFSDHQFDLALCSHLLFLYSDKLSGEFHIQAIAELLRVAKEVRVFPLQDLSAKRSDYLDDVIQEFQTKGYCVTEEKVDYEFQKGATHMLRIISK